MKKDILGSLVSYKRGRKEISLQMLARGISSPAAIQRLEAGERMIDYFVLERIIERLGRSLNKVELLYDEKVYEIHYLRALIEQYLEEEDYAEVQDALSYYESIPEGKEPIHKQYIYKIKGIVLSEKDKNHKVAAEMLGRALSGTVADFDMEKEEYEKPWAEETIALWKSYRQQEVYLYSEVFA